MERNWWWKIKRGADRLHPLMGIDNISANIGGVLREYNVAFDAHCYVWATNNHLPEGIELLGRLGFRYVTNTVWVKMSDAGLQLGLGQYQRGSHELLLFGTRGESMIPPTSRRFSSVIFAPRGKHSKKPDEFYDRIEKVSPGAYLELFARCQHPGWTSWGNEIDVLL